MAEKKAATIDIEAQRDPSTPKISSTGATISEKAHSAPDNFLVTFNGPDDPTNPKNWPARQKWVAIACISSFTFVSPLASTMLAPALGQVRHDFNVTSTVELQMLLSIFVLAFAIGPMLFGPLSEMYGRAMVAQSANIFFLIFNTLCGFATNKQQLMVFRFFAGIGGSAPLAIGGGVIGDLFKPEERGNAMGIYAMGILLAPAIGPVIGGWITQQSRWQWMFWAVSIADSVILIAGFIGHRESYAPYILHKKANTFRKETGNPAYHAEGEGDIDQPLWHKLSSNIRRSFQMLLTQPIVQVMSLYMGFSFGILYLMLSTYYDLFLTRYHQSIGVSGLNYISLGLGLFIGSPLYGRLNDLTYAKLKARDLQNRGRPEYRMPLVVPFTSLVPTGLLIYGWTAQYQVHWIAPNIGAFVFGIGTIASFQCITTYLVDTYTRFAASAIAAVIVLRSLMGFAFPLFAPAMYRALDYGWGASLLALLALLIGVPVPIMLWFAGETLRKKSSMTLNSGPACPPVAATAPLMQSTEPQKAFIHTTEAGCKP